MNYAKLLSSATQNMKESIKAWNDFGKAMSLIGRTFDFNKKFYTGDMKKIMKYVGEKSGVKCLKVSNHKVAIIPDQIIDGILTLKLCCHDCNEITEIDRIDISELK